MFASQLTDEWSLSTRRAVHWPPPSTRPISLGHSLRSVSPNSHDSGLQVRTIMASECISKLARSYCRCASPSSLDHGLQVNLQIRSITTCKCFSKFAWIWTPSLHDHGIQVHLHTRSLTASKCISKYAWLLAPSPSRILLHHGLRVYLEIHSITTTRFISKLTRSQPRTVSLSSLDPHFQSHLELLSSSACSQSRYTECRWVGI